MDKLYESKISDWFIRFITVVFCGTGIVLMTLLLIVFATSPIWILLYAIFHFVLKVI